MLVTKKKRKVDPVEAAFAAMWDEGGEGLKKAIKEANVKTVKQSNLSAECMMVQIWGLGYCETCRYRNKPGLCGGKNIRKTLKNEKGKEVPVGK